MNRFFVAPTAIDKGTVILSGSQAYQAVTVLRMGPGSSLQALDNSGWQYEAEVVSATNSVVTARITSKTLVNAEPRTKITIVQGLLKAAKFEVVLQKCTELGVVAFVPAITERSVVGHVGEVGSTKLERWNRIIVEAAEQSGRGKLPVLKPAMMLDQAFDQARGLSLLAWEQERSLTIREALKSAQSSTSAKAQGPGQRPFSVNLFIGPEGGFSSAETELARAYGILPVSLGRRTLRAETAAIAATALILYEMGDLGA